MPELTLGSIVIAIQDHVSSRLGAEAVILSLKNEVYFGLNDVGQFIWQQIQQPRSVVELRDAVVAEYEVAPQVAEADLLRLLGELAENGLIEIRDGGRD